MRWHALQAVPAGSGSGDSSSSSSDFCLFVCLFVIAAASLDVFACLLMSSPHVAVAGCPALPLNMAECQNFGKVFKLKFQLRK